MILHLKEIMGMKGISSIALAEKLGVSKVTVSYWINRKVFPDPDKLEKIADAVGVEVWELFKDPQADDAPSSCSLVCPHCGRQLNINVELKTE